MFICLYEIDFLFFLIFFGKIFNNILRNRIFPIIIISLVLGNINKKIVLPT